MNNQKESKDEIEEYSKGYEKMIRDLQNEISGLRENTREKEHQIKQLTKGMESGKAYEMELQNELNNYKENYFNLQNKQNEAKKKIQELEWNVQQQHSGSSTEINKLREYIKKIEPQLNEYQGQIRQLVNELNQTKQNAAIELNQTKHNATVERDEMIKASRQELLEEARAEHNRILGEKNTELEDFKQKHSEMEETLNRYKKNYPNQVQREVIRMVGLATAKKDQVIQRLQEQINQLLNQQSSQGTEMETEEPKIQPERIEIEETKEGPPPRQGMQTRSQGPPSFGEKIHGEVFDPYGNLTWKGSVYKIPNMGDYKAYDVVVNLISKGTGDNKTFKTNFVNYAKNVENDLRSYDAKGNKGYITKAVEILEKELNNDKSSVALAMKYIIEKNPDVYKGFKDVYEDKYVNFLKK